MKKWIKAACCRVAHRKHHQHAYEFEEPGSCLATTWWACAKCGRVFDTRLGQVVFEIRAD